MVGYSQFLKVQFLIIRDQIIAVKHVQEMCQTCIPETSTHDFGHMHWCKFLVYKFPLRLRVALRGERNRNTIGVSLSLATQRNAQP